MKPLVCTPTGFLMPLPKVEAPQQAWNTEQIWSPTHNASPGTSTSSKIPKTCILEFGQIFGL